MSEKTVNSSVKIFLAPRHGWRGWLFRLILVLWVLQLAWLGWLVREEILDIPWRLWSHSWGQAVRQENPFYRWLVQMDQVLPPDDTYLFVDNYEAGKEIEARYHLFPRRHLLIRPRVPSSLFFHVLRHKQVSYLLLRDPQNSCTSPGLRDALAIEAAEPLPVPGPGLAFRVNPSRIAGGFYD